ncbi:MAG TPA: F0F1 ATP synthase subunit [Eubacteriaceae bacterium]|nr:F0F1 ATP synthase subunit [Eubacteriaceae bacterium]
MDKKSPWVHLALLTQIGLSMFVPIAGSFFIGRYLDGVLGTGRIFLFVMTVLGVLAAFRNVYIIGMKTTSNKSGDNDDRRDK